MKDHLEAIARTPRLLIASDFDGTLGPIVEHPDLASPSPGVLALLTRAITLPQTCVAIVSGRAIESLRSKLGPLEGAWLVGGHGAEILGPGLCHAPDDVGDLLDTLVARLEKAAPAEAGFLIERKPGGVAVHFRQADPGVAQGVVDRITREIAPGAGLTARPGKMVIELMAVDTDKGRALAKLRRATGATAVAYLGDDATDEDAFRALGHGDLSIKIGTEPSHAHYCVPTLEAAHAILKDLVDQRESFLRETRPAPIEHHSILSDQRTIAVVTPDARVVWMCAPRIDSGAVFASLLDGPGVGFWSVEPGDASAPTSQAYLGDTFTLRTSWKSMRVTDYLDGSAGRTFQRAGRTDLVRVLEGSGVARISFAPRLDFGRVRTKLALQNDGILVEGTADPLVLYAPGVVWTVHEHEGAQVAVAEVRLSGEPIVLELRIGTRSLAPARIPEDARRSQTDRVWSGWASSLRLPSVAPDLCRRSALVLRALTYGPTGAILAAGTTGLPETAGGERNWDYRFCWPRDGAIAAAALVRLGNTGVAMKFLDWLLGIVDRCAGPERLRPIYTVTADELGHEADLSNLSGYRMSRPVRVGNAAALQVQLDVFGPIVELVHTLADAGAAISPDHWRLVEAMAVAVERSWREPDHGIWEIRTERLHHVHSKAMCWLALDRAVRLADLFVGVERASWRSLRDEIRAEVLDKGFDPARNAFVSAYDHRELDAATLAVGLSGMIEPTDHRFVGTIDAVQSALFDRGTLYRYRYDDGLAGPEGGFHICTGWLIESLLKIGRKAEARSLFDTLCRAAGPTGLLSEQWCPREQTGLGNFPQAYSHAAVISAACALSRCQ